MNLLRDVRLLARCESGLGGGDGGAGGGGGGGGVLLPSRTTA